MEKRLTQDSLDKSWLSQKKIITQSQNNWKKKYNNYKPVTVYSPKNKITGIEDIPGPVRCQPKEQRFTGTDNNNSCEWVNKQPR